MSVACLRALSALRRTWVHLLEGDTPGRSLASPENSIGETAYDARDIHSRGGRAWQLMIFHFRCSAFW